MKLELSELAESLQLPLYTVERWIRQGRIPVRKTGSTCMFKRSILVKWAEKHDIIFNLTEERKAGMAEDEHPLLLTAMERGGVHYGIKGETVDAVLTNAVIHMPGFTDDERDLLLTKLLEREKLTSTGIGKGVAIPHPRSPLPGKDRPAQISTFFLDKTIDFKSLDDKPVSVMFVIVCPSVKSHLHLLSRISFCLRDDSFIHELQQSPTPDIFFKKIEEFGGNLEKA